MYVFVQCCWKLQLIGKQYLFLLRLENHLHDDVYTTSVSHQCSFDSLFFILDEIDRHRRRRFLRQHQTNDFFGNSSMSTIGEEKKTSALTVKNSVPPEWEFRLTVLHFTCSSFWPWEISSKLSFSFIFLTWLHWVYWSMTRCHQRTNEMFPSDLFSQSKLHQRSYPVDFHIDKYQRWCLL